MKNFNSVAKCNVSLVRKLTSSVNALTSTQGEVVWAILHCVKSQDTSQLATQFKAVKQAHSTYASRYADYVVACLDGVTFKGGKFAANETVVLSPCAQLSTSWGQKIAGGATQTPFNPIQQVNILANKLARVQAGKSAAADGYTMGKLEQMATLLATLKADFEDIKSGTYGVTESVPVTATVAKLKAA